MAEELGLSKTFKFFVFIIVPRAIEGAEAAISKYQ